MQMKKYKLGEIAEINASSIKSSDKIDEILYLDTANITENRIDTLQRFGLKKAPSRAQRKVKDNTIIFSTVRPNQSHFGIMKNPASNLIVSSGFATLDIKKTDEFNADYLYYNLTQPFILNYLQTVAQNQVSSYPSINPSDLANLNLSFPPFSEQKKIASVLSTLDEKIALNRCINAKLEQMAKRLYDYWFVQFDFPNSDGKPYKSSGGKMAYNAELKREIPEGWEVKNLEDVLDNAGVATASGEHLKNLDYCPIDEIPMRTMSFAGGKSYKEANSSLQLYEKKDILIGAMRVYFHRCCIASKKGITRTTTIVLRPRQKEHLNYLYQVCNEENTFDFAIKVSSGTQQPYVTWNALSKYQFACPNNTILIKEFCDKIDNITDRILINVREIEKLISIRDKLLPLLMNGQAEII